MWLSALLRDLPRRRGPVLVEPPFALAALPVAQGGVPLAMRLRVEPGVEEYPELAWGGTRKGWRKA